MRPLDCFAALAMTAGVCWMSRNLWEVGINHCRRPPCRSSDTDVRRRDLLEKMRRGDGGGRVSRDSRPEIRMRERRFESGGRLPNGMVQVGRTIAERAVKLGRDEARLTLHERRIVPPDFDPT